MRSRKREEERVDVEAEVEAEEDEEEFVEGADKDALVTLAMKLFERQYVEEILANLYIESFDLFVDSLSFSVLFLSPSNLFHFPIDVYLCFFLNERISVHLQKQFRSNLWGERE